MNNIHKYLPTIKIHPILMIFVLIGIITGTFLELFIIFFIVLFHELGHFLAARYFNWRVLHINLWIFGGVLVTDEHTHKPLYEQTIVTLAGPFQHVFIYIALFIFDQFNFFSDYILQSILLYNTIILLFNFLPIWPLDGGKLMFILCCFILPYRYAHEWTIRLSIIISISLLVIQIFYFSFTLSASLIMVFIIVENWSEWKQRFFIFIRFLLQRYHGKTDQKSLRHLFVPAHMNIIEVLSNFKFSHTYLINVVYEKDKHTVLNEEKCLDSFFRSNQRDKKIGDIFI